MKQNSNGPKILLIDIETSYLVVASWGIGDQTIGLNQILEDWSVLSWAARWLGSNEIIYQDNRAAKKVRDDKNLLKGIHKLLNEADIVVGQNSKSFDVKKLNARFAIHGFPPVKPFKQVDTLVLARKYFKFTSNKLEHLCKTLNLPNRKHKSDKFVGMKLWDECLAGNLEAWKEMQIYNTNDVLTLEDLYNVLAPYGIGIDFNIYRNDLEKLTCNCGSTNLQKRGYNNSSVGRFQRYQCKSCRTWMSSKINLEKKDSTVLKKDIK